VLRENLLEAAGEPERGKTHDGKSDRIAGPTLSLKIAAAESRKRSGWENLVP